jgi:hypothetical protein
MDGEDQTPAANRQVKDTWLDQQGLLPSGLPRSINPGDLPKRDDPVRNPAKIFRAGLLGLPLGFIQSASCCRLHTVELCVEAWNTALVTMDLLLCATRRLVLGRDHSWPVRSFNRTPPLNSFFFGGLGSVRVRLSDGPCSLKHNWLDHDVRHDTKEKKRLENWWTGI